MILISRWIRCVYLRCPITLQRGYAAAASKKNPAGRLVYEAPYAKAILPLKVVSIATSVGVIVGTPVLVAYGNTDVPIAARIALSGLLMTFGLGTTAMCHWCLKSYVTRMFYDATREMVTVETLSLFSRRKTHVFHVRDARVYEGSIGFANFQVNNKPFFVHTEVFKHKVLLAKLLGTYV
ncbi:transmembrane protein 70, mitochondrial-like [Dysidea avara]|uniref:transmembrane protein 70, mitochondrial-like n=1 Tax=Dysidea avara TaxID=196820 RepID=UPI003317ED6D